MQAHILSLHPQPIGLGQKVIDFFSKISPVADQIKKERSID